jgi:hypothetical protein
MSHDVLEPETQPAGRHAGVEANARLTATTGTLLALLLLIEGFTVLDVRGYITLHTALGLILIGPVLLKTVSTTYRFFCYYTGRPAYVAKGPPHIVLRLIGQLHRLGRRDDAALPRPPARGGGRDGAGDAPRERRPGAARQGRPVGGRRAVPGRGRRGGRGLHAERVIVATA